MVSYRVLKIYENITCEILMVPNAKTLINVKILIVYTLIKFEILIAYTLKICENIVSLLQKLNGVLILLTP